MGHIQIAAGDDRLDRVQRTKAFAEGIVPRHAMVDALQAILRVRRIASDKIKIRIFQRDHPALVVKLLHADAVGHGEGLSLREDRRAGIALLLRRAPELLIPRQLQRDLLRLELCLLQAEQIRVRIPEEVQKALLQTGAKPVDVPRDTFHRQRLLCF